MIKNIQKITEGIKIASEPIVKDTFQDIMMSWGSRKQRSAALSCRILGTSSRLWKIKAASACLALTLETQSRFYSDDLMDLDSSQQSRTLGMYTECKTVLALWHFNWTDVIIFHGFWRFELDAAVWWICFWRTNKDSTEKVVLTPTAKCQKQQPKAPL